MSEVISKVHGLISTAVERWPAANLAISLSGVTAAALSLCKIVTIVGGAIGAVCSAIAGIYAVLDLIKKHRKK